MAELRYHFRSNVVPRHQWDANSGYCGETSLICAGMSFGQYCSQWTARALASSHPQYEARSQLLLGTGEHSRAAEAAREMKLQYDEFDSAAEKESKGLILWAKRHLLAGHVPIIGVFNNGIALDEWKGLDDGDASYDHIVPIVGFTSDQPMEKIHWPVGKHAVSYSGGDGITLSDNGLYGTEGDWQLLYSYEVAGFQGTRQQANSPGALYMLSNTVPNYGIVIMGVADHDGFCLPVRLSCDVDREPHPHKVASKDLPPTSHPLAQTPLCNQGPSRGFPMRLTATVDLTHYSTSALPGGGPYGSVECNLYRYDDFKSVPAQGFNAAAGNAAQVWRIPANSGPTFTVEYEANSNETVVFRAVPVSAP